MARILFLTPQLPYPPQQGTAIRNYGLVGGLAARGHRPALLSFAEPGQPPPGETPLAALCEPLLTVPAPVRTSRDRLRDLLAGQPDMARRLWSPDFAAALQDLLRRERFDAVHFEGLEMATYLPTARPVVASAAPGTLLVYDAHNVEHALQARIARRDWQTPRRWPQAAYSSVQARRLARFESSVVTAVDRVLACSAEDAARLAALGHATPITIIPNAISITRYDAVQPPASLPHPALVFTGKMDYRPNVDAVLWFAEEVLPRVREAAPGAHFAVVGQKPHARLDALRGRPGVLITGQVPEIQPYISAADVVVAPLRMGSGTRLKLLEAMAMGRAIVSTRLGAEGLGAVPGEHLLLADEPEAFAQAVLSLLGDEARRERLGEAARQFVRERYDWGAIIPRLEAVYETD